MKYLITAILLITSLEARAEFAEPDKVTHFFASYAIDMTLSQVMKSDEVPRWKSHLIAGGLTLAVGLVKEIAIDDHYDAKDMNANLVGVLCSKGISLAFDF